MRETRSPPQRATLMLDSAPFRVPDPRPVSEGGIGRRKPPRGWRRKGRKMATREEWAQLRAEKINGECRICETLVGPFELHHLLPRAQGGDDLADNLVPLCVACHDCVTRNNPDDLHDLAAALTDGEYAYLIGKRGESALVELFGVGR